MPSNSTVAPVSNGNVGASCKKKGKEMGTDLSMQDQKKKRVGRSTWFVLKGMNLQVGNWTMEPTKFILAQAQFHQIYVL
jgi:hypothetical protein